MAERSSSEIPGVPEQSAAARELLRAFREHESPGAGEREEGFVALQARLHAEAPAPAANGRVYSIARATLVTVAVAAAVLLAIKAVGSGVTALADRARQPAMESPYHGEAGSDGGQAVARAPQILPTRRSDGAPAANDPSAPAPATSEVVAPDSAARDTAGSEPSSDTAARDTADTEPSPAASSASRSPRSRSSAPAPADAAADALAAELALIKRATEAKKELRWADGLAALREHAERFPRGVLADERRVLKAELHCAAGRVTEADALVEAFLREHPGSALAGRMRNVCRD